MFSLSKILVLLLIVVAVWYGFKIVARRNQNLGDRKPRKSIGSGQREATDENVQDMETCAVCGTFVPNASARACGREGCPYPE